MVKRVKQSFSAALCVSLRSLRLMGIFNAEVAEIRRGPQMIRRGNHWSSPNHPRRSIHFVNSSTGETVKAAATMMTQSIHGSP
jgi:hypothetical protein